MTVDTIASLVEGVRCGCKAREAYRSAGLRVTSSRLFAEVVGHTMTEVRGSYEVVVVVRSPDGSLVEAIRAENNELHIVERWPWD